MTFLSVASPLQRKARQLLAFSRMIARHALRPVRPFLDDFLNDVSGVIHVGANAGQERHLYDRLDLAVIWVEAIPQVFEELQRNIAGFARQTAINCVLTDADDQWVDFNVADNDALSSSIFDLKEMSEDRPDIQYVTKLRLPTTTFRTMVDAHAIDLNRYQALAIDVQGAELLVLKGAGELVRGFSYVKAEAAEGEPYAGGCTADELIAFMRPLGFRVQRKVVIGKSIRGKRYYDIVFKRK